MDAVFKGFSMLKEFKEFAMRGNVLDLAIGVIIGAAFGAIVTSLVNDIVMPPIGMAMGQVDFKDLFLSLNGTAYPSLAAAKTAGAPVIAYGQFLNTVLNFLIVAFIVFLIVKQVNRMQKPAAAAPSTKECPYCANSVSAKALRCGFCTSELR
ncbi:MAG: large conductance mechanosensitive channel protein MscL [Bryobacteraceae bacterium]